MICKDQREDSVMENQDEKEGRKSEGEEWEKIKKGNESGENWHVRKDSRGGYTEKAKRIQ